MKILFSAEEAKALTSLADDIDFPMRQLMKADGKTLEIKEHLVVRNLNETQQKLSKFPKSLKKEKGDKVLFKIAQMFPKGFVR